VGIVICGSRHQDLPFTKSLFYSERLRAITEIKSRISEHKSKLFVKKRVGAISAAIEDEEESVGNWSLLEDDKAAGCSLLLEERGASAGCSIEGCDPYFP
jgi:hypothetical protein